MIADISIPPEATRKFPLQDALILPEEAARELPLRPRFSNKGTYGRVLVVAGSREMTGGTCSSSFSWHESGVWSFNPSCSRKHSTHCGK